jgi:hypothetical protein
MNQRSLHHVVNQRVPKDDLPKLLAELRNMHDRAAAIVAATFVEDALEDTLLSRMARLSKAEHDRLFRGDAPLSTFAAKIRVCRAFKLLSKTWADEITAIKDIRNAFAHARISINFSTPEITARIKRIRAIESFIDPVYAELGLPFYDLFKKIPLGEPRARFLHSCLFFWFMLSHFPPDPDFDLGDDDDDDP